MQQLKFHHLGKVVDRIEKEYKFYQAIGFKVYPGFEKKINDKFQNVKVGAVLQGHVLVELLEPVGKNSPIRNFFKKGHGFHHICYQTKNLEKTIKVFSDDFGFRQITPINISVWGGRPVVFFITKKLEIIELIKT